GDGDRGGLDDRACRAGSDARDERRRSRGLHARGPDRPRGRPRRADARADHRGLLRPATRPGGGGVTWVNDVVQGILLGGFYGLLACGLALMFGLMRIINLAHGDLAVLGAYLIYLLLEHWHVSPFLGLLPVLPVMLGLGYLLQRTILERSLRSGLLVPLLTTFGLSIVIQNLLQQSFSPDVRSLGQNAGSIATASWQITSQLSISAIGALTLGVAVAIFGGLQLYLS